MERFQLETLLAELNTSAAGWLPFLDIKTLTVGLYQVRTSDEETHQPHPRDEVYYVLSGEGLLRTEGEDQPATRGTVLFVPAFQPHHFHSITEELTLLVFFSNASPSAK